MGTAEVVDILLGCDGWFFSRFVRGEAKGWISGTVAFVSGDDNKVIVYLERQNHWDKRPPVEIPVHLISGAHDDGQRVHLTAGELDLTLTRP